VLIVQYIKKTVNCICSKEKEISQMHEDISLIQRDVAYIREAFAKDLKSINKVLYGNGKCGLIEKTDEQEKYINGQKGQVGLIKWLVGSGVVFSVISLFIVITTLF
jgi:hypothetical protein